MPWTTKSSPSLRRFPVRRRNYGARMTEGQAPPPQPPAQPPPAQPPAQPPPAQPPPPPGYQPPEEPRKGFFGALFDTRFDNLITPSLVRFLFIVSMILLTLAYVVWVVAGFASKASTGVLALVLGPLIALLYLILIRVYLELIVVLFKIREAAEETAENTRRG
jgi:hypothetical protein